MDVRVFSDAQAAGALAARQIAALVHERAADNRACVLGLAAGATPMAVYRELIRLHREGLSFANVVTFNLDEYYPISPSSLNSCGRFIRENFIDHLDLDPASVYEIDGSLRRRAVANHCECYEQAIVAAGGIDLQLLGIGRNGHIAFNEPGSPRNSRTRLVTLDSVTRHDAQTSFGDHEVPRQAITMGIDTIVRARRILLLATGPHKAAIVANAVDGMVTDRVPASYLQEHPNASVYLDPAAAGTGIPLSFI